MLSTDSQLDIHEKIGTGVTYDQKMKRKSLVADQYLEHLEV